MMKKSRLLLSFFLFAFVITLTAAIWQTQRARYKYKLEQEWALARQHPPQSFIDLIRQHDFQPNYQTVTVKGHFLTNKTLILINKFHQHRVGEEVVSPFMVLETGQILLVNQGWIEKLHTNANPYKNLPETEGQLTGMIDKIRSNPFILDRHEIGLTTWPAKQLQLRPTVIASALKSPVYPFQLRLVAPRSYVYTQAWQPVTMPWQKHVGYAIQWLLLALTSLIMAILNRRSTNL